MIFSTKTRLKVEYIRDISIAKEVILNDVLHIPDFKYNLTFSPHMTFLSNLSYHVPYLTILKAKAPSQTRVLEIL